MMKPCGAFTHWPGWLLVNRWPDPQKKERRKNKEKQSSVSDVVPLLIRSVRKTSFIVKILILGARTWQSKPRFLIWWDLCPLWITLESQFFRLFINKSGGEKVWLHSDWLSKLRDGDEVEQDAFLFIWAAPRCNTRPTFPCERHNKTS